MKINKKLSAAIVLSLMLGVYGSASAADRLYGNSKDLPVISVDFEGYATTDESKATSSNSEFEIISGTWDRVYGGKTENGDAENNTVNIKGGIFETTGSKDDGIFGGYAINGNVKGNTVDVEIEKNLSLSINSKLYGGYVLRKNSLSTEFAANGNSVSISGGSLGSSSKKASVYGGYVEGGGTAQKNEVSITGSTITGDVSGGYISLSGSVKKTGNVSKENKVSITDSTINGDVRGGYIQINNEILASSEGAVNGNEVEISQAKGSTTQINGNVYGGWTKKGDATGNTVTITGGTIGTSTGYGGEVYGGYSDGGSANGNKVEIDGAAAYIRQGLTGGYAHRYGDVDVTANDNVVTFKDGRHGHIYGGYVLGGGIAQNNELIIEGGSGSSVFGGYVDIAGENYQKTGNAAINNKVTMTDGSIQGSIYGGILRTNKSDVEGIVQGNEVNVSNDSRIAGTIYGGDAGKGDAISNTVTIACDASSYINGHVYGGKSDDSTGSAKDNIVNFGVYEAGKASGIANVNEIVHGGKATTSTGNTLNVYTVGNNVGGLEDFQNMNFYIPKEAAVGDVLVESSANINLANVKVLAGFHNDTALTNGDKVKLIKAPEVNGFDGVSTDKVAESDFTNLDIRVYQGDDAMNQVTSGTATTLVAEIVGEEASESSKSLVETVAVGTAIIAEGGDLLAGAGLANAQAALAIDAEHGAPAGSATLFGAINANKSKIKSGSHVDVKGMNLNLGLVKEIKNNAGKFIVGPVVEYGKGKYDSYLDNGYHGEGDSHFVGGGLVAKQNNNNGMYYEGSVRAGKLMSDYKSNGGNYDSDSTYLAAHLGLGKVVKLNEKNSLDYYGKYFYSHQGSDDTTLHSALDHALHFDGVDSHRTRLGGRLNHVVKENNEVYIGFAWQHEFSSTARATIDGLGTPAPSCKGDTGIMELGWKVSETNKYDVDLGATGSIGKKKGAGINLSFNYKF